MPFAKRMMDDAEGSQRVGADDLSGALYVQQIGAPNFQALSFSSRLYVCTLAQITDGAAWSIDRPAVRLKEDCADSLQCLNEREPRAS